MSPEGLREMLEYTDSRTEERDAARAELSEARKRIALLERLTRDAYGLLISSDARYGVPGILQEEIRLWRQRLEASIPEATVEHDP